MLWQAASIGSTPFSWPRPDGPPLDNGAWSSPSRLLASLSFHYGMAGGWWPTLDVKYVEPKERLPEKVHPLRRARRPPEPDPAAPAVDRHAAQGVLRGDRVPPEGEGRQGARHRPVADAPAAHHHPRLPRLLHPVTAMTTPPLPIPCRRLLPRVRRDVAAQPPAGRPRRRRDDDLRLRRAHLGPCLGAARPCRPAAVVLAGGLGRPLPGGAARRPGLLPGPTTHRRTRGDAAGQGRLLRAASGPRADAAAVAGRQGGRRPRVGTARAQPVALLRDGAARGCQPRLDPARRLAQPADRGGRRSPRPFRPQPGRGRPARRAVRAAALPHRGLRRGRPRLRRRPRRPEAATAYVAAHAVGQRQDRARGPRCARPSRPST